MIATAGSELGQAAQRPGLVPSINKVKPQAGEVLQLCKLDLRCTRLRKNLGVAAKQLSQGGGQSWMVTLTYRGANGDWRPSHVRDCLRHVRGWAKRCGFVLRYLWVIETKDRLSGAHAGEAAPHYHLIVWLPVGVECPHFDTAGWWPHGMTNVEKAKAPVRYVMKYVSKFDAEASFPKGARCYGVGGIGDVGAAIRRWINWPAFVQARASVADSFRRASGGGWLNRLTGEWWPSEWGLSFTSARHTLIVRLHDHGRPVADVAGPYNWLRNSSGVAALA
jgi:hypothetical protein